MKVGTELFIMNLVKIEPKNGEMDKIMLNLSRRDRQGIYQRIWVM